MKFKVGDIVYERRDQVWNKLVNQRKIIDIKDDRYIMDQTFQSPCGYKAAFKDYSTNTIDGCNRLYIRKIKATKIAKKMNQGKIEKEEDGWLYLT